LNPASIGLTLRQKGSPVSSRFSSRAQLLVSSDIRELLKVVGKRSIISFAGGTPEPNAFPFDQLTAATHRVLASAEQGRAAFQYSVTEGNDDLRSWVQTYMRRRGVEVSLANILITSGAQQGIDLMARLFLDDHDRVALSDPTYLGALQVFSTHRPDYLTVATDDSGSVPESVKTTFLAGPKLFYVVPDFLNPTGISHSLERRKAIVQLARESKVLILEDAAYEQLRYEGDELPPLIALDAQAAGKGESDPLENGNVVYLGTFSKTVVPGFRVGWVVGPAEIIQRLTLLKQAADLHSNTFGQSILSQVLDDFENHVSELRKIYGRRRDCMLEALSAEFPEEATWTRPAGGFFVWARVPGIADTRALLERAIREEGVAFVPGHSFFVEHKSTDFMRLSFSASDEPRIREGIKRLGKLISNSLRSPKKTAASPASVP
jgi:DNA-binding transcriptional MocR family regulator